MYRDEDSAFRKAHMSARRKWWRRISAATITGALVFFGLGWKRPRGCPSRPLAKPLLWLRLSMAGEGASGWRGIVSAAAVAARELGFGLVLPCVRDSELVCCFEEDDDCGADYKTSLRLTEARTDVVVGTVRSDVLDLDFYFDLETLEKFVAAPVLSPRCLPRGLRATPASSRLVETPGGLAELAKTSSLIAIHDAREGIFGLAPYRQADSFVSEAAALFADKVGDDLPLRIAPARRRDALRFIGSEPYDVIMWRSELVSPDRVDACAAAVLAAARRRKNKTRKLVFVSDIAATVLQDGGPTTLWDGHYNRKKKKKKRSSEKEDRLNRVRRDLLYNLTTQHDLGVTKYDLDDGNWNTRRDTTTTTDRGAVGLTEQYIAIHASVLWVQRSYSGQRRRPTSKGDDAFKPRLGRCGWEGRFLTTVLAARHAAHQDDNTRSWFDDFFA